MRLIQPIFASYSTRETGLGKENKIYNAWKEAGERVKKDIDLGVKEFLLFYIPEFKFGEKSSSWREGEGIDEHKMDQVCVTAASLSAIIQPQCRLIVDVCLCSYTQDGHCCITGDQEKTDRLLLEQAKSIYTASGATIAPSDCQDNTVKNIKSLKDGNIEVMSYSTKFRSTFYRGWRNAMKIEKFFKNIFLVFISLFFVLIILEILSSFTCHLCDRSFPCKPFNKILFYFLLRSQGEFFLGLVRTTEARLAQVQNKYSLPVFLTS